MVEPASANGHVYSITTSYVPAVFTSTSHVMRSLFVFQLTKYEQFGALLLRRTPPCGTPSRAGSGVQGNSAKPTGNGRSSPVRLPLADSAASSATAAAAAAAPEWLRISLRHAATASFSVAAMFGCSAAMSVVWAGS